MPRCPTRHKQSRYKRRKLPDESAEKSERCCSRSVQGSMQKTTPKNYGRKYLCVLAKAEGGRPSRGSPPSCPTASFSFLLSPSLPPSRFLPFSPSFPPLFIALLTTNRIAPPLSDPRIRTYVSTRERSNRNRRCSGVDAKSREKITRILVNEYYIARIRDETRRDQSCFPCGSRDRLSHRGDVYLFHLSSNGFEWSEKGGG